MIKKKSDYKILYFPHKSIFYGNMFLKDQFYSNDKSSPFHKSKILNIESESLNEDAKKYYNENNIPFTSLKAVSKKIHLKLCINYFKFIYHNINLIKKYRFFKIILFFDVYKSFEVCKRQLIHFNKAKIALLGYDILFPKTLSLALESKEVTTVATQERFFTTFYNICNVIIGTYFVSNIIAEKFYKENKKYSSLKNIKCIGQVRCDLLHKYKKSSDDYINLKTNSHKKIVLALDYHSPSDEISNLSSPLVNWENNKIFYEDLIKLAEEFKNTYIIIRGKNNDWTKLEYFKQICRRMSDLDNIIVDLEVDELNRGYKLAANADIIVARHTSLIDESLAVGIPVLVHDYYKNIHKLFSEIYNYEDAPIFVHSYDDLEERVRLFIKEDFYMEDGVFEKMKEEVFGNFYDGKVKERLHNELMKIYNEC